MKNNPLTFAHAPADADVVNGRERERYIKDGRISNREPVFATGAGTPLNVVQLDRLGYHDAAHAKRGFAAAMTEWSGNGGWGRRPTR